MKLIIDIPEQMYLNAKSDTLCGADILVRAIKNGTPLDKIRSLCCEHEIANSAFDKTPIIAIGKTSDGDAIWEDLFNYIQTIIEADKAESEDKE